MNFIDIGIVIRNARKAHGLSQATLAAQLQMSRATISGVENGTFTDLGVRKLSAICDCLGLTIEVITRHRIPTYHELIDSQRDSLKSAQRDTKRAAQITGTGKQKNDYAVRHNRCL